jgi:YD repeat-containing protein
MARPVRPDPTATPIAMACMVAMRSVHSRAAAAGATISATHRMVSERVTTVTDPRGNVAGANPANYTTTYGYDDADQVLSRIDPAGHWTTYTYNAVGLLERWNRLPRGVPRGDRDRRRHGRVVDLVAG